MSSDHEARLIIIISAYTSLQNFSNTFNSILHLNELEKNDYLEGTPHNGDVFSWYNSVFSSSSGRVLQILPRNVAINLGGRPNLTFPQPIL